MIKSQYEAFKIEGSRLSFGLDVPATVEEYDQLAGKPGACLESGIDNIVYRGGSCLPEIRYQFCNLYEGVITREFPVLETDDEVRQRNTKALFRKTKKVGTKKGKNGEPDEDKIAFAEGEAEYVRRTLPLLALLRGADEVKVEEYQYLMDRVLGLTEEVKDEGGNVTGTRLLVRFDPTEREPAERGPKTLPKKFLAAATQIVNQGGAQAFLGHFNLEVAFPDGASDAEKVKLITEAIGWKIKALEDAEAAKTNLAAKYGVPSTSAPTPTEAPVNPTPAPVEATA